VRVKAGGTPIGSFAQGSRGAPLPAPVAKTIATVISISPTGRMSPWRRRGERCGGSLVSLFASIRIEDKAGKPSREPNVPAAYGRKRQRRALGSRVPADLRLKSRGASLPSCYEQNVAQTRDRQLAERGGAARASPGRVGFPAPGRTCGPQASAVGEGHHHLTEEVTRESQTAHRPQRCRRRGRRRRPSCNGARRRRRRGCWVLVRQHTKSAPSRRGGAERSPPDGERTPRSTQPLLPPSRVWRGATAGDLWVRTWLRSPGIRARALAGRWP
jgi:hypothetical protein